MRFAFHASSVFLIHFAFALWYMSLYTQYIPHMLHLHCMWCCTFVLCCVVWLAYWIASRTYYEYKCEFAIHVSFHIVVSIYIQFIHLHAQSQCITLCICFVIEYIMHCFMIYYNNKYLSMHLLCVVIMCFALCVCILNCFTQTSWIYYNYEYAIHISYFHMMSHEHIHIHVIHTNSHCITNVAVALWYFIFCNHILYHCCICICCNDACIVCLCTALLHNIYYILYEYKYEYAIHVSFHIMYMHYHHEHMQYKLFATYQVHICITTCFAFAFASWYAIVQHILIIIVVAFAFRLWSSCVCVFVWFANWITSQMYVHYIIYAWIQIWIRDSHFISWYIMYIIYIVWTYSIPSHKRSTLLHHQTCAFASLWLKYTTYHFCICIVALFVIVHVCVLRVCVWIASQILYNILWIQTWMHDSCFISWYVLYDCEHIQRIPTQENT